MAPSTVPRAAPLHHNDVNFSERIIQIPTMIDSTSHLPVHTRTPVWTWQYEFLFLHTPGRTIMKIKMHFGCFFFRAFFA